MASHDELNRDTGLRCAVELLNHPNIVKGVHLGDNASVAVRLLIGNLDAYELLETAPHIARGDDERLILLLRCVPGDEMKQVDEVGAYVLLCRKVTEIRIKTRRDRIVVAGSDVAVCTRAFLFFTDHKGRLAVRFQTDQAVRYMHARSFEHLSPLHVVLLIEPRLHLHKHRHLLARLGSADERLYHG